MGSMYKTSCTQKEEVKPLTNVMLVIDNVRSVINVGSIFRTSEGFGVGSILLSGYTPGPIDRFGRVRQDFHKAALGSEQWVPWSHVKDAEGALKLLQKEKRELVVLEQNEHSADIQNVKFKNLRRGSLEDKLYALVIGNETEGVNSLFIKNADMIIEIPMFGEKESFNVSSATAIALYAFFSQTS